MNLLKLITPTNLESEKQKFLSSESYNPVFEYRWEDDKNLLSELKLKLEKSDHAKFNIPRLKLKLSVLSQNNNDILKSAQEYFQVYDFEYLNLAEAATSIIPEDNSGETIEKCQQEFNKSFQLLSIDEYKLQVVDKSGFNFRPAPKDKLIFMSKYTSFQFFNIEGEVRHELAHVIRYENSKFNRINFSQNYLPTEEGLATYLHDTTNDGGKAKFQHAVEYLASKVGMDGSLRDIYDLMRSKGFNKELAWHRSSRHKFGFKETKLPGDILKPAMYFANSQKVSSLEKNDLYKLFVGKISIEEVSNIKEYTGRIELNKIQSFYGI